MLNNDYVESLTWRYATKKFDPLKKIPKEQLDILLESLRLAPSSLGVQPWKFVVVTDPGLRLELRKHADDQPQITDSSHLIVLCAKIIDEEYITDHIENLSKIRNIQIEDLKKRKQSMINFSKTKTKNELFEWAKNQVYIALGFVLSAAVQLKIDSCPMEGFDPKKFDEILGLEKLGLRSAVLCPVGYRSEDDNNSKLKKVRFDKKDVVLLRD